MKHIIIALLAPLAVAACAGHDLSAPTDVMIDGHRVQVQSDANHPGQFVAVERGAPSFGVQPATRIRSIEAIELVSGCSVAPWSVSADLGSITAIVAC